VVGFGHAVLPQTESLVAGQTQQFLWGVDVSFLAARLECEFPSCEFTWRLDLVVFEVSIVLFATLHVEVYLQLGELYLVFGILE